MKIVGSLNRELLRQEVIDELESEGLLITIDAEQRLFTAQIPSQVPRDSLVSLVLRIPRTISEHFVEDYSVTLGADGAVVVTTHFTSTKYREIG